MVSWVILFLYTNTSSGQCYIGLGVEYGWNNLINVNPNELSIYGHSGKQSNQRSAHSVQPLISLTKGIGKKWDLELGVGYSKVSHFFDFDYMHQLMELHIDTTVTFTDQWLMFPVNFGYHISINNVDRLRIGVGLRTMVLWKGEDNYMGTVLETIEVIDPHNGLAFVPEMNMGYTLQWNEKWNVQLGGYIHYNPFPMTGTEFGFYKNIYNATNLQYGIYLKTHLKISEK